MRTVRALAIAVALVSVLPAIGAAQQTNKPFEDAWFWGVKTGGFWYTNYTGQDRQAPMIGADWLITRTHGGLYVSISDTFLSDKNFVVLNSEPSDTMPREYDLKDVRRLEVAGMIFPGEYGNAHPYAGFGLVIKQVGSATTPGAFADATQLAASQEYIQSYRTGFSPLGVVGSQFKLRWASVFVQATVTPVLQNQFLYNSKPVQVGYEVGLRYNIGSSIDKQ